jgi:hypothetical protein
MLIGQASINLTANVLPALLGLASVFVFTRLFSRRLASPRIPDRYVDHQAPGLVPKTGQKDTRLGRRFAGHWRGPSNASN